MLEEMSLSFIKKSLRKHCLNLELQALFLLGLKFTVDYEDNYLKLNIGELIKSQKNLKTMIKSIPLHGPIL